MQHDATRMQHDATGGEMPACCTCCSINILHTRLQQALQQHFTFSVQQA